MHILFLTDNFPPEVNAPASRTFEHAREWVKAGCEVTVVTCTPNFPKGEVFPGYRNRIWQTEYMNGIRVVRVWSYISSNEGVVRRILDYQSYMVSAVLASPFLRKVDIVIGTSPQFFTACAAYVISRIKRVPFVFELRDLWPESIKTVGAMSDSMGIRFLEKLELFLYRKADLIVAVTESFRDVLIERGLSEDKIEVVTNGVDASRFYPLAEDHELARGIGLDDEFVAGYIGTHGMAHSLDTLLDAAERLKSSGEKIRILLLGDGAEKGNLLRNAADRNLDNVTFLDSVSKDQIPRYWALLDVSIIHLKRSPLFKTVIPSKMFEAFAMGIPVLLGVEGEAQRILARAEAGDSFVPEDAKALADQLRVLASDQSLLRRYSENGRQAAREYDRSVLASRMLASLHARVRARAGEPSGAEY